MNIYRKFFPVWFQSKMMRKRIYADGPGQFKQVVVSKKRKINPMVRLRRDISRIKKSQELKWHDVAVASAAAGGVEPLNNVPLGDDAVARDGRKIIMTSLMCRLVADGGSATLSTFPRMAIVYDKVPNGVLPSATDIFVTTDSTAMPNLNNRDRFVILYDNFGGMGHNRDPHSAYSGTLAQTFGIEDLISLRRKETIFKDTGSGTTAGTATGGLYAVFLGTGAVSAINARFRLRFLDS